MAFDNVLPPLPSGGNTQRRAVALQGATSAELNAFTGVDAQLVYDIETKEVRVFDGTNEGGYIVGEIPTAFSWNFENAEDPPAGVSFTRATTATVLTTTDGTTNWYQTVKAGEIRYQGLRRVENLLDSAAGSGPFTSITEEGRVAVSVIASSGTLTITIDGNATVLTPTGTPHRFVAFGDVTGTSAITIAGTATLSDPMAHLVQIKTGGDLPEPYLAHTETTNAGVAGVKYFATTNGNTVDGNGVVTEAAGSSITGGGYLSETASTNRLTETDLTEATWTKDGVTISSDGINSLGLEQVTVDAGTGNSVHRVFETVASGITSAGYFIAKAGTGTFVTVRKGNVNTTDYACYNLTTGSITETGAGDFTPFIEDLGDGWYKVGGVSGDADANFILAISDTATPGQSGPSFTGSNETILVAHAQYETVEFPTSPIVTSGSTVTRNGDSLLSGFTPTDDYSVFADATVPGVLSEPMCILGSSSNQHIRVRDDGDPSSFISGINIRINSNSWTAGVRKKAALGNPNDASGTGVLAVTGETTTTDTSSSVDTGEVRIGARATAVNNFRGLIHKVSIYDSQLTTDQLETLVE